MADQVLPPGLYDAFRSNGAPTYYEPNQTPFAADVLESGLIFAFAILAASFFAVLPGIRGKEKWFTLIRVTTGLFIGAVILLANFSYTWETAELYNVTTKYKAGSAEDIHADIEVHVGLRGINITLKADAESQRRLNETINYNEHYDWRWRQGRFGFGPFAGRFNREFRESQFRGVPLPILWVAEYFTFDGEGVRWGRHYRQAGWFAHILMWLALPLWFLSMVLFFVLLKYGAYFLIMTGTSMVVANVIWATLRNPFELVIPFAATHRLVFHYGGSFWVNLITGILCIVLGIIIYLLDLLKPQIITSFFGVDVLQDWEEGDNIEDSKPTGVNGIEMQNVDQGPQAGGSDDRPPAKMPTSNIDEEDDEEDDDEIYMPPTFAAPQPEHNYIKRKSRGLTQRFQQPRRRPPPPPLEQDEDYDNALAWRPEEVHLNMP